MLSLVTVALAGVAWLVLMFAAALYGERRPNALAGHWHHVYALSLAVHCTSWTFYGTVTQAVRHGWWIPPTLVGAIVFYLLAARFMGWSSPTRFSARPCLASAFQQPTILAASSTFSWLSSSFSSSWRRRLMTLSSTVSTSTL